MPRPAGRVALTWAAVMALVGAAAVVVGVAMVSLPVGLITAGVLLLAGAYAVAYVVRRVEASR